MVFMRFYPTTSGTQFTPIPDKEAPVLNCRQLQLTQNFLFQMTHLGFFEEKFLFHNNKPFFVTNLPDLTPQKRTAKHDSYMHWCDMLYTMQGLQQTEQLKAQTIRDIYRNS